MQHVYNFFKVECHVGLLYFFIGWHVMGTKSIIEQLQSASKSFFSVITANAVNKDQGLI